VCPDLKPGNGNCLFERNFSESVERLPANPKRMRPWAVKSPYRSGFLSFYVVPALPIPLVATVLLESTRKGLGAFEVEARVNHLIEELRGQGACVYVSPRHRAESVLSALKMLELRKLVRESQGIYSAVPEEIDVLTYYANSIAHWRQFATDSNDASPPKQSTEANDVT
jgi:Glycerol-3-phosphate acyltransferase C-terminal region